MTAKTAYTASSHEATKNSFSRRALIGGTAALGAVGLLSACGNGSASSEKTKAAGAGANIEDLYNINAQDVNSLKKGGTLRLPAGSIGPNFNFYTQSGNTSDNVNVMSTISQAGMWNLDFDGTYKLNTDFAVSFEHSKKGDKVQVAVKLNPKAVFNDGTPITYKALQSTWNIFKSLDNGYNIVTSGIYEFVESVEKGEDDYSAIVTFSKPFYPLQSLFSEILHPALEDIELFNNGFVDAPHPEYWAGPFTLADKGWDSTAKTFSVVPNDKWWGTKPALERITWREMSSQAEQAAYKNNEIDYVDASTLSSYNELSGVANTDIRKGSALGVGNYEINPEKVPLPVRRAFVAALNREQLQKLRYEKLGWKETLPGSMCMLPMQEGYQDNYPTKLGKDVATKILEDAGYTKSGDYYTKDGAKVSYPVITFGSDPVVSSTAQFLVQQMKEVGIELTIENHGASEMSSIISSKNFAIKTGGYGITTSPVDAANYFYISETNNGHGKDLDSLAATMMSTEDPKEQLKIMNELEKRHLDEVAIYVPTHNGPNFKACRKGLANYGPMLFGLPYYNPNVWINVGWEK